MLGEEMNFIFLNESLQVKLPPVWYLAIDWVPLNRCDDSIMKIGLKISQKTHFDANLVLHSFISG